MDQESETTEQEPQEAQKPQREPGPGTFTSANSFTKYLLQTTLYFFNSLV